MAGSAFLIVLINTNGDVMGKVLIENAGNVAIIRLNNGTTNAVNLEMVQSLSVALGIVEKEYKGMVLAGGEKFFCIGLDLPALLKLNKKDMADFWHQFNKVTLDLYTLPMPTVCAMVGHGPAAGTIWALACDFRIVADEKTTLGLNEIQLGIPAPLIADLMLRQITSDQTANELLYTGKLIPSKIARELQIVNDVCSKNDVEQRALLKVRDITCLSNTAYAALKAMRNSGVLMNYEKHFRQKNKTFLDIWFSDHTQEKLHEAVKFF